MAAVRSWLRGLVGRRRFERDLDDELRFHLEEEQARAEQGGMTPAEAALFAQHRLGAPLMRVKEECRDRRGLSMIDDVGRDLTHGARLLRRSPGFAAVVLTTLAVAIGATVTVFSTVDAWLLRPLNFPGADRLVIGLAATVERPNEPAVFLPYRAYLAWKDESRAFASVSAAFPRAYLITGLGEGATANGMAVTPEFFETLGVPALVGRTLSAGDANNPAAVLSYGLWERQFGAARSAIESTVALNGVPHRIVGVMPRDFDVRMLEQTRGFEVWTLFAPGEPGYGPGGAAPVAILGRLRGGVSIDAAQIDTSAIHRRLEAGFTPSYSRFAVLIASLQADNARAVKATLMTVGGAVAGLLLIACLNVGTLLVGRGLARAREAAIRMAIGCDRSRLARQLLTESALICVLGGLAGVGVAWAALRLQASWEPLGSLPPNPTGVDLRAVAVAFAVTTLAVVLCGVWPALRVAATPPIDALRSGGTRGPAGRVASRAQALLLGGQMAVSMVLLIATALLARTFVGLQREPLGFTVEDLTVASLSLPTEDYDSSAARNQFAQHAVDRLQALPGVQQVAASTSPPLASGAGLQVRLSTDVSETPVRVNVQDVSRDFFATLQIPLVAGRQFESLDSAAGRPVVILNERAARTLFGSPAAALGRMVHTGAEPGREVIGVVGNTRSAFFNTLEWLNNPVMYWPAAQALAAIRSPTIRSFELHMHIRGDQPMTMAEIRQQVSSVNPRVAVTQVRTATDLVASATRQPGLRVTLLTWFAAGSLLLAALGVYGIVGQSVAERLRELGVRLALGASPQDIVRAVTTRVLLVGSIGIVAGSMAALLLGDLLQSVIYGVRPTDVFSFAVAAGTLLAAAAAAASIPARRATRIDPVRVLRTD